MVADGLKPAKLIGAETPCLRSAAERAMRQSATRPRRGGARVRLLLEGEADKIDEVGGNFRPAAAHVRRIDALIGVPELVRGEARAAVDGLLNQLGQRLDLLEREADGVGLAIENLQHFDLVLVVAEKLLKCLSHAQGAFANHFRGAGFEELVLVDGVDDLLVTLLDAKNEVAQGGIGGQRLGGLIEKLLAAWASSSSFGSTSERRGDGGASGLDVPVGVERRDNVAGDRRERLPVGRFGERGAVVGRELAIEPGEAGSDGAEHVLIAVAEGDQLEELFKADVALAFERLRVLHLFRLKADGVDDDEVVLGRGRPGVTFCSSVGVTTRAPRPFICSNMVRLLTARMKKTISSGRMSVPVAIMSTVTAMRGIVGCCGMA